MTRDKCQAGRPGAGSKTAHAWSNRYKKHEWAVEWEGRWSLFVANPELWRNNNMKQHKAHEAQLLQQGEVFAQR